MTTEIAVVAAVAAVVVAGVVAAAAVAVAGVVAAADGFAVVGIDFPLPVLVDRHFPQNYC